MHHHNRCQRNGPEDVRLLRPQLEALAREHVDLTERNRLRPRRGINDVKVQAQQQRAFEAIGLASSFDGESGWARAAGEHTYVPMAIAQAQGSAHHSMASPQTIASTVEAYRQQGTAFDKAHAIHALHTPSPPRHHQGHRPQVEQSRSNTFVSAPIAFSDPLITLRECIKHFVAHSQRYGSVHKLLMEEYEYVVSAWCATREEDDVDETDAIQMRLHQQDGAANIHLKRGTASDMFVKNNYFDTLAASTASTNRRTVLKSLGVQEQDVLRHLDVDAATSGPEGIGGSAFPSSSSAPYSLVRENAILRKRVRHLENVSDHLRSQLEIFRLELMSKSTDLAAVQEQLKQCDVRELVHERKEQQQDLTIVQMKKELAEALTPRVKDASAAERSHDLTLTRQLRETKVELQQLYKHVKTAEHHNIILEREVDNARLDRDEFSARLVSTQEALGETRLKLLEMELRNRHAHRKLELKRVKMRGLEASVREMEALAGNTSMVERMINDHPLWASYYFVRHFQRQFESVAFTDSEHPFGAPSFTTDMILRVAADEANGGISTAAAAAAEQHQLPISTLFHALLPFPVPVGPTPEQQRQLEDIEKKLQHATSSTSRERLKGLHQSIVTQCLRGERHLCTSRKIKNLRLSRADLRTILVGIWKCRIDVVQAERTAVARWALAAHRRRKDNGSDSTSAPRPRESTFFEFVVDYLNQRFPLPGTSKGSCGLSQFPHNGDTSESMRFGPCSAVLWEDDVFVIFSALPSIPFQKKLFCVNVGHPSSGHTENAEKPLAMSQQTLAAMSPVASEVLAALLLGAVEYGSVDPDLHLFHLVANQLAPEALALNFFWSLKAIFEGCVSVVLSSLDGSGVPSCAVSAGSRSSPGVGKCQFGGSSAGTSGLNAEHSSGNRRSSGMRCSRFLASANALDSDDEPREIDFEALAAAAQKEAEEGVGGSLVHIDPSSPIVQRAIDARREEGIREHHAETLRRRSELEVASPSKVAQSGLVSQRVSSSGMITLAALLEIAMDNLFCEWELCLVADAEANDGEALEPSVPNHSDAPEPGIAIRKIRRVRTFDPLTLGKLKMAISMDQPSSVVHFQDLFACDVSGRPSFFYMELLSSTIHEYLSFQQQLVTMVHRCCDGDPTETSFESAVNIAVLRTEWQAADPTAASNRIDAALSQLLHSGAAHEAQRVDVNLLAEFQQWDDVILSSDTRERNGDELRSGRSLPGYVSASLLAARIRKLMYFKGLEDTVHKGMAGTRAAQLLFSRLGCHIEHATVASSRSGPWGYTHAIATAALGTVVMCDRLAEEQVLFEKLAEHCDAAAATSLAAQMYAGHRSSSVQNHANVTASEGTTTAAAAAAAPAAPAAPVAPRNHGQQRRGRKAKSGAVVPTVSNLAAAVALRSTQNGSSSTTVAVDNAAPLVIPPLELLVHVHSKRRVASKVVLQCMPEDGFSACAGRIVDTLVSRLAALRNSNGRRPGGNKEGGAERNNGHGAEASESRAIETNTVHARPLARRESGCFQSFCQQQKQQQSWVKEGSDEEKRPLSLQAGGNAAISMERVRAVSIVAGLASASCI